MPTMPTMPIMPIIMEGNGNDYRTTSLYASSVVLLFCCTVVLLICLPRERPETFPGRGSHGTVGVSLNGVENRVESRVENRVESRVESRVENSHDPVRAAGARACY